MQIVSIGGNFYEKSNPVSREKWDKYLTMSSADNFTQSAKG